MPGQRLRRGSDVACRPFRVHDASGPVRDLGQRDRRSRRDGPDVGSAARHQVRDAPMRVHGHAVEDGPEQARPALHGSPVQDGRVVHEPDLEAGCRLAHTRSRDPTGRPFRARPALALPAPATRGPDRRSSRTRASPAAVLPRIAPGRRRTAWWRGRRRRCRTPGLRRRGPGRSHRRARARAGPRCPRTFRPTRRARIVCGRTRQSPAGCPACR